MSNGDKVSHHVPRIEILGLSKKYGQKFGIKDVDLTVEPGQFLVLLGPSGSGKSTLLRCIAGIERPSHGVIRFDEKIVDGGSTHVNAEKRNLSMVFQDYALWPHLTAEQNVAFALQRLNLSSESRQKRSREMLDQVGLSSLYRSFPGQLSGGEQQRVALARALVANPGILLFDEPLSNLDADRRERLRVDIGSMVRSHNATAVYITHDQAEAFALADVVGVLNSGKIVQIGTPEEIYRSPKNAFVARFTGLAGEFEGKVTDVGSSMDFPDLVSVDVGGSIIRGRSIETSRLNPGQRVNVLVRTSAVQFVPSLVDYKTVGNGSTLSCLGVTVLDAAFRGWGYEHVVLFNSGVRLTGIVAERRQAFRSQSFIEFSAEGCLVVKSDPASVVDERERVGTDVEDDIIEQVANSDLFLESFF